MRCILKAPEHHQPLVFLLEPFRVWRMLPLHNQCFPRDFKIVLFVFQHLLDFFSKELWGGEAELKGQHYALLDTTQAPAS